MDAPSVQYATTPDGIKLAYAVAGGGPGVIFLPFHHNHLLRRWSGPPWISGLTNDFRVLHYDSRGQGMSERGLPADLTIGDYGCDLETMVQVSGFERFALIGYGGFGHVALRYAVEHPERVSALVLICSCESFKAWTRSAFLDLAEENWDLFVDLQASHVPAGSRETWISFMRDASRQEDYVRLVRCFLNSPDLSELLPKVSMPSLLLHSLDQHWLPPVEGAGVAAKIPGARIVFTDGDVEPDVVQAVSAMLDFLKHVPVEEPIGPMPSAPSSPSQRLSPRQVEVLRMIAEGKQTREIAGELTLSERTVERHIAGVYGKIGARNRSEATAFYLSRPDLVEAGAKYPTLERSIPAQMV